MMKQMMNAPPVKCTAQDLVLWQKIQQFRIDDPAAALPFSRKLALQQHWDDAFTLGAIAEYRKFILLCCISPHGASPSAIIDEVWHLHLIYTENYWEEFCGKTLQRKLHHHPGKGGPQQKEKYQRWHQETLQQYRQIFLSDPPPLFWTDPPAMQHKTGNRFRGLLQNILRYSLLLPLLLITGCSGDALVGLMVTAFLLLVIGISSAQGSSTAGHKKKDQEGGSSCGGSSGGCSSSCGGGCGGGCGGCGS